VCSAQNGADEPQVMPLPSSAFTSVITGPTTASGVQLSENTYDCLLGLVATQVP